LTIFMRGRFSIFLFVALVVALLVALNAASYVHVEREPELESNPDRSSSNAGPTGTRAIYEYLEATGHKVTRWRDPIDALLKTKNGAQPSTFVVVGAVRRQFTDEEKKNLTRWVARGGRLVVIDRLPEETLERGTRWGVASAMSIMPGSDSRADVENLLAGTKTIAPTQPTLIASAVERVAPSRYASRLRAVGKADAAGNVNSNDERKRPGATPTRSAHDNANHEANNNSANNNLSDEETAPGEEGHSESDEEPPPPAPTASPRATPRGVSDKKGGVGIGRAVEHGEDNAEPDAPVLNFADERGALVADYARGRGHVVVLADPFIVANNGIARADNLQLATNVIAGGSGGGIIAFDEYHQGRGATGNQLINYFAGTPVVAMFCQLVLITAVVVFSRGRRFARPIPALRPDRRSKLEFVASMAELQQRARAFDLALENIYSRTRRALARYGGTDVAAPRAEIAASVAARSGIDRARLENLMRDCEDAAAGEPTTARRALALATQLRELERTLGIRMRSREIKQAERL
jgi:hypothetical protein